MERKKYLGLILVVNMIGISFGIMITNNEEFQNLTTEIIDVSWEVKIYQDERNNYTKFWIHSGIEVYNPNDFEVNIRSSCCHPFFDTNLTWNLEDPTIEIRRNWGWENCGFSKTYTFYPGLTYNTTFTRLYINGRNVTTLPDGEYNIWVYHQAELLDDFDSYKRMLKIENGVPTFPYFPPIKISLPKFYVGLSLIITTLIVHIQRRNRKYV